MEKAISPRFLEIQCLPFSGKIDVSTLALNFFLSLLYMPYLAAGVGWEEYEANDLILPRGQI